MAELEVEFMNCQSRVMFPRFLNSLIVVASLRSVLRAPGVRDQDPEDILVRVI